MIRLLAIALALGIVAAHVVGPIGAVVIGSALWIIYAVAGHEVDHTTKEEENDE